MTWREILNKGFKEIEGRRKQKEEEGKKEEKERSRKELEKLTIARNFVPRVMPVLQEFARLGSWGEVEQKENRDKEVELWIHDSLVLVISPLEIRLVRVYSTVHERHTIEEQTVYQPNTIFIVSMAEFTEEKLAEALTTK